MNGPFYLPKCSKILPLELLGRHFGLPGVSLAALLSPRGLHRGSLEALQERLGTSQGHLEAPGIDLGGFLPPKPPKMMTVVGIHDAASRILTTVTIFGGFAGKNRPRSIPGASR